MSMKYLSIYLCPFQYQFLIVFHVEIFNFRD